MMAFWTCENYVQIESCLHLLSLRLQVMYAICKLPISR